MSERPIIKHYSVPLYEENVIKLKEIIGNKITTQEALTEAVQYTIENRISVAELVRMAKLEKEMGGKHGKQNI